VTLLVNLYGAPGAGKSTTAAGLFFLLKTHGFNAEYVSEFAKDLTWEKRHVTLKSQPYIFGKQLRNLERLIDQVDVIVTDSPLLLSSFYGKKYANYPDSFYQSVRDISATFNAKNFVIGRTKSYNPSGRNQTEEESDQIAEELLSFLRGENVTYRLIKGDKDAPSKILNLIEPDIR